MGAGTGAGTGTKVGAETGYMAEVPLIILEPPPPPPLLPPWYSKQIKSVLKKRVVSKLRKLEHDNKINVIFSHAQHTNEYIIEESALDPRL